MDPFGETDRERTESLFNGENKTVPFSFFSPLIFHSQLFYWHRAALSEESGADWLISARVNRHRSVLGGRESGSCARAR